jgi:hypothetical protein
MARPQVADGGDGLQIWRTAKNILNKQSRTTDEGRSSSLELGVGRTTHHRKNLIFYKILHRASDLDEYLMTDFSLENV